MKKRKAALVLAGGGARGVAHIGAIEELESQGFEITSVAGTSMGALVGGVYASGHLEPFKEWMLVQFIFAIMFPWVTWYEGI